MNIVDAVIAGNKTGIRRRKNFERRIYTLRTFIGDLVSILKMRPHIKKAFGSGRVSEDFRERIMLAVTAVNGCKYCSYYHVGLALRAGLDSGEIAKLLSSDIKGSCPEEESVALIFAQHYAETGGNPTREALKALVNCYGAEKATDILVFIRMIMLGNLTGNTLDAFISRLKGIPPEKGNPFFELIVFILGLPVYIQYRINMRKKKRLGQSYNRKKR